MKKLRISAFVAAMALGVSLAPQVSQAQSNTAVTVAVTDLANRVWDLAGGITNIEFTATNRSGDTTVGVQFAVALAQTGSGSIKGSGATTVSVIISDTNTVIISDGSYHLRGNMTSNRGTGHGTLLATVSGSGTFEGKTRRVLANQSISFTFDNSTANATLTGTERDLASAAGLKPISDREDFTSALSPIFGNGTWTLAIPALTQTHRTLTATVPATVTLNSGQVFSFNVRGVVSHDSTSRLVLSAADTATRGSSLVVTMSAANAVTKITGRITGQSVNLSF